MAAAMATASATATVAATPGRAYEIAASVDPPRFYPKHGPLPAVIAVRDQSGPWNAVGRVRTLELSDGGHVIESITDAAPPTFFAYELSDFQKVFKYLVSGARAKWAFEPTDTGTRITWTYAFHPLRARGWIVAAIVRVFWAPYMRRVLPAIAREVERVAAAS